jgi:hypothetical protein
MGHVGIQGQSCKSKKSYPNSKKSAEKELYDIGPSRFANGCATNIGFAVQQLASAMMAGYFYSSIQ